MVWNEAIEASCKAAGYFEAAAAHVRRVWEPYGNIPEAVYWAREMMEKAIEALEVMEKWERKNARPFDDQIHGHRQVCDGGMHGDRNDVSVGGGDTCIQG